jgi:penicillin-binding protein 1A
MSRLTGHLARILGIATLFLVAALAGVASGVLFAFVGDLPQISALDDYAPATITRVLGRDGTVVGEFASERRVLVTYDQIPPVLRNAIVSAEDASFFHHSGFRLDRIFVAAIKNIVHMRITGGASTITQQLARKLFLTDDQTPERKIKEAILTLQIEKRYTKEEIFTMYCNKVYWGHVTYGVEGASQLYFAKHASELTLDEAATLAGIIQSNERQSPYKNMAAAVNRRNYTLDRMAAEKYISVADAEAAKKRPIVTRGQPAQPRTIAPYFLEAVRLHLEDQYGAKAVLEGGLTVRTGIDPALQRAANVALDEGLRRIDKQRGFRRPIRNLGGETKTLEAARLPQWNRDPVEGDYLPAIVLGVENRVIQFRLARWRGTIDAKGYEKLLGTKRKVDDAIRKGDVIEVKIKKIDPKALTLVADLDQLPELQGAVLAIDNRTGQILAMIGGQNFQRSQFNRAIQAQRQVGSLFKPFVYTAAIERGQTAATTIIDEPVSFDPGPGQPAYEPKNFDKKYEGEITLRWALEDSRNVPTVKLMSELGPATVVAVAKQMGITSPLQPFLSTAIGSAEASLIEMTAAYVAYPNQGVRMTPRMVLGVTDRDGNVLEDTRAESREVLKADTAYILTNLLEGVIKEGTGASAKSAIPDWPIGGKTGTTDDYTDAWFIGFDPDITIGVWVGFDQKKTIGDHMEGAHVALPIWTEIMKTWVARRKAELPDRPEFIRPSNVITIMTERGPEVFIAGTEPGRQHHKP